eukprot:14243929-Alexandrium_andersonii.AAC.1
MAVQCLSKVYTNVLRRLIRSPLPLEFVRRVGPTAAAAAPQYMLDSHIEDSFRMLASERDETRGC